MEIAEIRRARLAAWFKNRTLPADEKSYLSQLITGKASSFGEKAARRLEKTYGMPSGFLDTPLDEEPVPDRAPMFTPDQKQVLEMWGWLTPEQQTQLMEKMKADAAHNQSVIEALSTKITQNTVSVSDRRVKQKKIAFTDRRKGAKSA